jgi:hypothetical protein
MRQSVLPVCLATPRPNNASSHNQNQIHFLLLVHASTTAAELAWEAERDRGKVLRDLRSHVWRPRPDADQLYAVLPRCA